MSNGFSRPEKVSSRFLGKSMHTCTMKDTKYVSWDKNSFVLFDFLSLTLTQLFFTLSQISNFLFLVFTYLYLFLGIGSTVRVGKKITVVNYRLSSSQVQYVSLQNYYEKEISVSNEQSILENYKFIEFEFIIFIYTIFPFFLISPKSIHP